MCQQWIRDIFFQHPVLKHHCFTSFSENTLALSVTQLCNHIGGMSIFSLVHSERERQQAYPQSCHFENALCLYPGMYCFYTATAHWIWLFNTGCTSGFWAVWTELSTGRLKLLTTSSCTISVQRYEACCWRARFVPFGNTTLRTPGLTWLAAESERIGVVDYNSVFILQKNPA